MTNEQQIDIRQESLLPFHFKIVGYVMIIMGAMGLVTIAASLFGQDIPVMRFIISSPLLLAGGAIIAFTHYRLKIDAKEKTYNVYVSLLGISLGKPESFDHIELAYINKVRESTRFTSRAAITYDIPKEYYKAFFKLDNGEKIHVDSDGDEEKLRERMDRYLRILASVYQPLRPF